jgi:hypothetical protein
LWKEVVRLKENIKQIVIRSIGLTLATAFAGTAVGAFAGDFLMGTLIGIGSAFAVVLTTLGVSIAWKGSLEVVDIQNAFRLSVAKSDNDAVQEALKVTEDGDFDWDDAFPDYDPELADPSLDADAQK